MESISTELFSILKYLLPGFVTGWIFHALTSYPKQNQFERIIQALIFNFIIQITISSIKSVALWLGEYHSFGSWNENYQFISSGFLSVLLGFLLVFFTNNGKFHNLLNKINITKQSSYFSEWEDAFNNTTWFIILNFKDGRRLYGWPKVWPSDSAKGHFVIQQPEWIIDGEYKAISNTESILVNVIDVDSVEFMKETPEIPYEPKTDTTTSN